MRSTDAIEFAIAKLTGEVDRGFDNYKVCEAERADYEDAIATLTKMAGRQTCTCVPATDVHHKSCPLSRCGNAWQYAEYTTCRREPGHPGQHFGKIMGRYGDASW